MLLDRLHHDQDVDSAWTIGGDFNCSLSKSLAMPEPTTLLEWTHSLGLSSPPSSSNQWETQPTYVHTTGLSRIDHAFFGGKGCECLFSTHYSGESYGDYTDHRPLSLSLKLQHGRGPAGLRTTKLIPLYKALLLPQSPEDEARYTSQIETWILQHPTPTTISPIRSGKWLLAFSKAANEIVSTLTNPHKRQMRQGFSPPGLYLTHTLHAGRLIRRGLQGSDHRPPWALHLAHHKTLQAYQTWLSKTQDIITKTTSDTSYSKTLADYTDNPLLVIPSPASMSLPDLCAHLNRVLPLLRSKLHSSNRQRLRRQASDRTRQMTIQAAAHKTKQAIRYTLGSKVPHYDFSSIRSNSNEIFFNPADVHNVTTKHFHDHFKAPDASPNFQIDYSNEDTLAASKALFMTHANHSAITPEIKDLLWTALTRPQTQLTTPHPSSPLRDQLRDICAGTPSFAQFTQTLKSKSNDSSPGPTGLSYRLLKLIDPQYLNIIYEQLVHRWSSKHIPE